MFRRPAWFGIVAAAALLTAGGFACAQQVTISLPYQNFSHGYFEYFGASWSYGGPGFFLRFGGLPPPAFGGFDPAAGLTGGWTFGSGGRHGRLNFVAATGGSTVYTSTTPFLTVTEGVPGSLFIGRTVPFVTGVIPVTPFGTPLVVNPEPVPLGAAGDIRGRLLRGEMHLRNGRIHRGPDPLRFLPPEAALALEAPRPEVAADGPQLKPLPAAAPGEAFEPEAGVADPSGLHTPSPTSEAERLLQKGAQLEAEGKPGAARLLYQTALRTASGDVRERIEARLYGLPAHPRPAGAAEAPESAGPALTRQKRP